MNTNTNTNILELTYLVIMEILLQQVWLMVYLLLRQVNIIYMKYEKLVMVYDVTHIAGLE